MKLSARVRGDWFAVPCKGTESVKWLAEETLRRYYKAKCSSGYAIEKVFEVRKAKGGAILDQDDSIKHVLDDNDFVTVGQFSKFQYLICFNLYTNSDLNLKYCIIDITELLIYF